MQRPLSSDYFVEMKKYYHIAVLTSRLLQVIRARALSDYNEGIDFVYNSFFLYIPAH